MQTVQVRMKHVRSTKNTHLYKELDKNGAVVENMYQGLLGQVYIKQSVFNGQRPPDEIQVTIEAAQD